MSVKAAKAGKMPPRILAVRASAGAGKTYQLTVRFLELLKQMGPGPATAPESRSPIGSRKASGAVTPGGRAAMSWQAPALRQIVAITFTNRAAAEMKDRVILALKDIALGTDKGRDLAAETGLAPAEARAWLEAILDHFGDFQVRTIDSLLNTLMRAFAIEMGLPPEMDVDFDKEAVLDRCLDTLLASIVWENPRDPNRDLIVALVEAYLHIEDAPGMVLERRIRERIRDLYDRACQADAEPVDPDHAGALERLNATGAALLAAMETCGFTECFPKNQHIAEYLRSPRGNLDKAFWTKESLQQVSKRAGEFADKDLRRLDRLFAELKAAAADYIRCHPRARIYPYLRALAELRKEVRARAESEGELLGGTWLERVNDYLHSNEASAPYALLKMGSAVRHFLIDEFQDTSRRQWEALLVLIEECLATGGTLFYVGDVKQAIYGWRGGDWKLFGEVLSKQFPSVEPARRAERVLETNYRSLPAIVDFNNRLYSTLLDPDLAPRLAEYMMPRGTPADTCQELAATLAENFRDVAQKVRPRLPEEAGRGHVCVVDILGDSEAISADVEGWLRRQVREAWDRRGKGMAVLVRSNAQAEAVAAWLVAEGIPIVTENSLRLRSSPLVKGLVALLHFLEYPLEDMAFWGALASPLFAGLVAPEPVPEASDSERSAGQPLADFLKAGRWQRPLYRAFERAFPEASKRLVRSVLSRSGYLAPYDLVREVLATFDVERRFPDQAVFTNRFLEIVFQAEARRSMSLSSFLRFWDETGAEEQVGLPEDLSAVRILTIHKAKGLEFPVVFVPFTNWKRRPDKEAVTPDGELVWLQASGGVPLPPDLAELRLGTAMEDVVENLNTLYVATTRPREELYLYVTCPIKNDNPNRQYLAAWLMQMMGAAHLDRRETKP